MDFIFHAMTYFVAIMGLLFFLPPLIVILFKMKFRLGCKKAYGRVLRIEKNRDPDSDSILIQPVIEFTDFKGERFEVKSGSGYGLKYMPRPGQTVKLYYRPNQTPVKFQLASRGLWEVSAILMATGLTLMLPAFLTYFFSR